MEDFSYIDFKQGGNRAKIEDNEISLSFGKNCKSLTFSQGISKIIKERRLKYFRLVRNNLTSELLFTISNDDAGIKIVNLTNANNVQVHCNAMIDFLGKTFSMQGKSGKLFIGNNIANSEEFMTFRLKKASEK